MVVALLIISFAGCAPAGNENNIGENDIPDSFKTTLYFADSDAQKVVKEERTIELSSEEEADVISKAKHIIEELIRGSEIEGQSTSIPDNTKVLSVQHAASVLVVNFSKEFETEHSGGSTGIIMTFAPLVLSLTEIEGVEEIWFLVEGEPVQEFKGHMDLSRLLSRAEYEIYISE